MLRIKKVFYFTFFIHRKKKEKRKGTFFYGDKIEKESRLHSCTSYSVTTENYIVTAHKKTTTKKIKE